MPFAQRKVRDWPKVSDRVPVMRRSGACRVQATTAKRRRQMQPASRCAVLNATSPAEASHTPVPTHARRAQGGRSAPVRQRRAHRPLRRPALPGARRGLTLDCISTRGVSRVAARTRCVSVRLPRVRRGAAAGAAREKRRLCGGSTDGAGLWHRLHTVQRRRLDSSLGWEGSKCS